MNPTTIVIPCRCCEQLIEQPPNADFFPSLTIDRCFACRMHCQRQPRYGCNLTPTTGGRP